MVISSVTLRISCAFALLTFARPQEQQGEINPIDGLALPLPAAPVSLEAVAVTGKHLPDGKETRTVIRGKVYRDAAGRTRHESTFTAGIPEQSMTIVSIVDMVAGFKFLLVAEMQSAYRFPCPKPEPYVRPGFAFLGGSKLMLEAGDKTHKNESLGQQIIEGIEFTGFRITTALADKPSWKAVDEYWTSEELGLIGKMLKSSPSSTTTVTIKNVVRREPDSGLFGVPRGYAIVDGGSLR